MPTLLGPRSLRTLRRAGFFETLKPTPAMLRLLFDAPFRNSNLGTAVRLHTAATPDRIAMIDDGGALTWARLDERVSRLAHVFLERAGEGARVAFILRNGRENVECYCACGRAGLAAVPVNTWSTAAELKHVLSTQKAALLVADREFAGVVEDAGEPVDV